MVLLLFAIVFAYLLPELSTTHALALGGGIIFLVVCLVNTGAALYLLIFSMLLSPEFVVGTTKGAGSLGREISLRIDDFLLLILGFTWLAKMAINKDLGLFVRTPINKPIAYYLLACLTSTLLGSLFLKVDLTTGFFFVLKYFEYVFIYFVAASHVKTRKQVSYYIWAIIIVCAITSFIGITQIPGRVSAPFEGEMGEPNTFGGYLVFIICITAGFLLTTKSLRSQLIYGVLMLLFFIPLFYTQSRASYLAVIPACLAFVWLSDKRRWVLIALVLGVALLPFVGPKEVKERVEYTYSGRFDRGMEVAGIQLDTSTTDRLTSMISVIGDFPRHPFFGFGITGYKFFDAQYFKVLIETGIIGFLFFVVLMSSIFRLTYHNYRTASDPLERGLCMGFLAGFVGLLFHALGANTFIIVRIMEPFWFVLAIVIVLPDLKSEAPVQKPGAKTVSSLTKTP
ncbi:MAG: O-antigen ligase family protein [Pseudomonadota bacterium]